MHPACRLLPVLLLALCAPARADDPARVLPAGDSLAIVLALGPPELADPGFLAERNRYWLRCQAATRSHSRARGNTAKAILIFLANAPVEVLASQRRHREGREPLVLNAAAFALMGLSFLHLSAAYRQYEDYERDRGCCRMWQEYAGTSASAAE